MPHCYLILATFVFLCRPAAAADWPQFRGPSGDGTSKATNVPIKWSDTENVTWKQAIPGVGWSSPVLSKGMLYLTTAVDIDDAPTSLRAVCIDTENGRIIWNTEVFQPAADVSKQKHEKNGLASPTPIVDRDRLYVHFGHMGTAALDLGGNVLWRQTTLGYQPRHGNGGSPLLIGDLLVISCDDIDKPFIAALDRASGDVRWKTYRNTTAEKKFSFSTPIAIEVDGREQIVSQCSGLVGAYDPKDGREIWRVRYGEGYSVVPRPVFAHGLLFVASGFERPILHAIDPKGASGDATETNVTWNHDKGAPLTPSVVVVGNEIYFVSDKGVATCLDAKTGKLYWTKRLGGDYSASPILAEGRIYFLSEDGVGSVVKATKEFELLATNQLGERTLASPVATNGALYLRSESHLWRIQSDTNNTAGN